MITYDEALSLAVRARTFVPENLTVTFSGALRRKAPIVEQISLVAVSQGEELDLSWNTKLIKIYPNVAVMSTIMDETSVEIFVVKPRALGGALIASTGPAEFTTSLKRKASAKGFNLSQQGLYFASSKEQMDTGSEENIFMLLDVPWLKPEDRTPFGRVNYEVHPMERYVLASDGKSTYRVRVLGDKSSCECKSFEYRNFCKHVTQVRQDLNMPTPLRNERLD